MLRSSLVPDGMCTTEDRPRDLPSGRKTPRRTPVSNVYSPLSFAWNASREDAVWSAVAAAGITTRTTAPSHPIIRSTAISFTPPMVGVHRVAGSPTVSLRSPEGGIKRSLAMVARKHVETIAKPGTVGKAARSSPGGFSGYFWSPLGSSQAMRKPTESIWGSHHLLLGICGSFIRHQSSSKPLAAQRSPSTGLS